MANSRQALPRSNHLAWLKKKGFNQVGHFSGVGADHRLEISIQLGKLTAVYVFLHAGIICYVGSAEKPGSRLSAYSSRQFRGLTERSRYVHRGLIDTLASADVEIFVLPISERYASEEGIPVDRLLGIESGMIHEFDPPWNKRGRRKIVAEN